MANPYWSFFSFLIDDDDEMMMMMIFFIIINFLQQQQQPPPFFLLLLSSYLGNGFFIIYYLVTTGSVGDSDYVLSTLVCEARSIGNATTGAKFRVRSDCAYFHPQGWPCLAKATMWRPRRRKN